MPIGDTPDFLRGIKETVGDFVTAQKTRFSLGKSDAKAKELFPSKVAKEGATSPLNQRISLSLSPSSTIKRIASSVKEFLAAREAKKPQGSDRQKLLESFRTDVLDGNRNKKAVLTKTMSFFALADKMGQLDKAMYNTVSREIDRAFSRCSIVLDGSDDLGKTVHDEFLEQPNLSSRLKGKLESFQKVETPKEQGVDSALAKELIAHAKPLTQSEVNGHTIIGLPNGEVLLKQEKLGEGAGAIVFKGLSLTSNREVVIKYPTEMAKDTKENENAQKNLNYLGRHDAIQNPLELYTVETKEGPQQIAIDNDYFKHGDPNKNITMQEFFKKIGLNQRDWDNPQARGAKIKEFGKKFSEELMDSPKEERKAKLEAFSNENGPILRALMGDANVDGLLQAYKSMMEKE